MMAARRRKLVKALVPAVVIIMAATVALAVMVPASSHNLNAKQRARAQVLSDEAAVRVALVALDYAVPHTPLLPTANKYTSSARRVPGVLSATVTGNRMTTTYEYHGVTFHSCVNLVRYVGEFPTICGHTSDASAPTASIREYFQQKHIVHPTGQDWYNAVIPLPRGRFNLTTVLYLAPGEVPSNPALAVYGLGDVGQTFSTQTVIPHALFCYVGLPLRQINCPNLVTLIPVIINDIALRTPLQAAIAAVDAAWSSGKSEASVLRELPTKASSLLKQVSWTASASSVPSVIRFTVVQTLQNRKYSINFCVKEPYYGYELTGAVNPPILYGASQYGVFGTGPC